MKYLKEVFKINGYSVLVLVGLFFYNAPQSVHMLIIKNELWFSLPLVLFIIIVYTNAFCLILFKGIDELSKKINK